jgi:hypothetical protein
MRWPVESAIQESKGEPGLDHDEVCDWVGWHHHTTMTLLAHHFLVRLRRQVAGKGTDPHRAAGTPAPAGQVPRRPRDAATLLALLAYIQRQNHAAYHSHRRRRLRRLDSPQKSRCITSAALLSRYPPYGATPIRIGWGRPLPLR